MKAVVIVGVAMEILIAFVVLFLDLPLLAKVALFLYALIWAAAIVMFAKAAQP